MEKIENFRLYASNARHFVVVHPTAPPLPEPFFKRGVIMVAPMMILDSDSLFKHVLEGAGTTLFKEFRENIVFRRDD